MFSFCRTLLWLSVVSLPLMGIMWVLAVLAASENSQILTMLLSATVVFHAFFCLIGYCIINKRVRENLNHSFLRCLGRKVPLLDSSQAVSVSSQNATSNPRSPGGFAGASYETSRKHIGISASSTTSKSTNTNKTSSSPYRSEGQIRHTSTSTSNYNSDGQSYMRGYNGNSSKRRHRDDRHGRRSRKDSDSGSETDGRSLELASSHSSDEEESRVGQSGAPSTSHGNAGISAPSYLPNITEHVQVIGNLQYFGFEFFLKKNLFSKGNNTTGVKCRTKPSTVSKRKTSICISLVKSSTRNLLAKSKW